MNVFLKHGNPYTCWDSHEEDKIVYKNSHSNENPIIWKYDLNIETVPLISV